MKDESQQSSLLPDSSLCKLLMQFPQGYNFEFEINKKRNLVGRCLEKFGILKKVKIKLSITKDKFKFKSDDETLYSQSRIIINDMVETQKNLVSLSLRYTKEEYEKIFNVKKL